MRKAETIKLKFSLLKGSHDGQAYWIETQETTTDAFGAFAVVIGQGERDAASKETLFEDINFANQFWLKIEIWDNATDQWLMLNNEALQAVPYARYADNGVPVGSIIPFAGPTTTIPKGWMLCDGRDLSITEYAELFAAIGYAWGAANGNQSFRLPSLGGQFLRGVAHGSNEDPDRASRTRKFTGGNTGDYVGSYQNDEIKSHNHNFNVDVSQNKYLGGGNANGIRHTNAIPSTNIGPFSILHSGGSETRPKNAYVNYIIKVK